MSTVSTAAVERKNVITAVETKLNIEKAAREAADDAASTRTTEEGNRRGGGRFFSLVVAWLWAGWGANTGVGRRDKFPPLGSGLWVKTFQLLVLLPALVSSPPLSIFGLAS